METYTAKYAERELSILTRTVEEPVIAPFIPEILALCEKFGKNGESGGSAPYTAAALSQAIKKLCLQEPICDITGIDEEWMNLSEYETLYQNNRCSALFKNDKGAYYLDAIVFKTQNGDTYSSNAGAICKDGSRIESRQFIESFPFKPKTFYIDVIEKEVAKDDWEFYIKEEKQLEAVSKYYDTQF